MQSAEDFDAFVAIVDAGSISEAARKLGVPRATLSRQLARLEERLGVRLVHRSTRSLVLNRAGEALYPRARRLLESAQAAVEAVQRLDDVPRGLLRVASGPLNSPVLGALVGAFTQVYPDVTVELLSSSRHIDLVAEQIDVALRGGVVRDPSLITRPLLRTDLLAVATPQYLAQHGGLEQPADLAEHACLRGFDEGVRATTAWPLRSGGRVNVDGPLVSNDPMALLGAAVHGVGLALLPRELVRAELAEGRLVPVLEDVVGTDVSLSLVWSEREFLDPKIRAFIDLAAEWAAAGRFGIVRTALDFGPAAAPTAPSSSTLPLSAG